ncbi:MAG: mannosyltransferase [candidate division WS6 bacterium GW2011_GWC1_33_20]|uniref:Glycosyl transferase group 1 n=2 Tax=Candidatus Dojkabacteria TaxID=74243 RepID=A0A0G0AUI0_9BACT|nr:MAG: mannosyltransferase [candidate division WS6 bacterium GW2011_GWC1_33_20]KKP44863.1 MAG: mannosyltransferase [candidate division WS6 bacterium GW2011_GWF1_33_233]KKP54373.1 MAG: mannosyltransferase [candidate division WS6 bacterium GW2011_WS6_33_547]KKP55036.1 MAG: Glycosyl transferase group 1 [candidate division WS6 bacterium GW2011_GWB1_33_6]KKP56357.1 MAG: Glycosyl transferase group 1 [candidate division WS6 bacterium GW2011_GWF2_33_92]KKP81979.1 MAG: Glycosyl transferase group 1 [ca
MHLIVDCTTTQNQLRYNGIGQYTKNIVKRLIEKDNIELTLLMFNNESTLDQYLKGKNVEIYRIGKVKDSDYKNILLYITKILPAIKKLKTPESIYFCPYFWIGIPSLHIPTVLMIHDFILPKFNIYSEKGYIQNTIKKVMYWSEMFKARYCKAILTNSKQTTKDFRKYFPTYPKENIYSIYLDGEVQESEYINGWNSKLPRNYEERGYFIYMGGTPAKNKNSDGVIKGYREFLAKVNHDIKAPYLVIAGKNFTNEKDINVSKFKSKVECLGLKDNVIFTGFYEDQHVKPLLSNSISFIHLSQYEGFGIALVEAMRSNTPVIAHNGSSYPEVLGDSGLLVDGLNPEEVGEAMHKVYKDKKLREELIEKGKERAKLFSWDNTAKQTIEVFRKITAC